MQVTKCYEYFVEFERGSADTIAPHPWEIAQQRIAMQGTSSDPSNESRDAAKEQRLPTKPVDRLFDLKARKRLMPMHRVDLGIIRSSDPECRALGPRRVEHILRALLTVNVPREQIQVFKNPRRISRHWLPVDGQGRPHISCRMYPDVESLSGSDGDPRLTFEECDLLIEVRLQVWINRNAERIRRLGERADAATWRRLLGHDTPEAWAAAGVDHPLWTVPA